MFLILLNKMGLAALFTCFDDDDDDLWLQEECGLVNIDIHCRVQGDVVLECIHLEDDLMSERMIFRVMFNTEFVRSNVLMLSRDDVDVLWDAKDLISKDFKAEVRYLLLLPGLSVS